MPQVLGVPRNADANAIARAYRKKISEVRGRDGMEGEQARIEAAHSAIMMAGLTARLQVRPSDGGVPPLLVVDCAAGLHCQHVLHCLAAATCIRLSAAPSCIPAPHHTLTHTNRHPTHRLLPTTPRAG